MKRVLVFGDSIAYGAWDTEGGWVDRLKRQMHRRVIGSGSSDKIQVINLGIGGDTSTGVLSRFDDETVPRISAKWSLVIVIAIGTNDSRMKDGVIETLPDQFRNNLTTIIEKARRYTQDILLVDLPPMADDVVQFGEKQYTNERIAEYAQIVKGVAKEEGLAFADLGEKFVKTDANLFYEDSLHPSDAGHEIIMEIVSNWLERLVFEE